MGVHRLGVQRRAKTGKKGVFFAIVTNFGKDLADKFTKTHVQTHVFRVYFHT